MNRKLLEVGLQLGQEIFYVRPLPVVLMVALPIGQQNVDVDAHNALLTLGGGRADGAFHVFQHLVQGGIAQVGVGLRQAVEVEGRWCGGSDGLRP